MMRLFFDANILFTAAHNPKGKAALIIDLCTKGHWKLYTSAYAIEEARRNLEAKFPHALGVFAKLLDVFQTAPESRSLKYPPGLLDKDGSIYLAAHGCRATHLLTGDIRDFGPLMNQPKKTDGLVIQTVAQYLDAL